MRLRSNCESHEVKRKEINACNTHYSSAIEYVKSRTDS